MRILEAENVVLERLLARIRRRTRPDKETLKSLERLGAFLLDELRPLDEEMLWRGLRLGRQGHFSRAKFRTSPQLVSWLSESRWIDEPMALETMQAELKAYIEAAEIRSEGLSAAAIMEELRTFRHRQLLRIFLREIEGASLRQTTAEVADVAAVSLQTALHMAGRLEGVDGVEEDLVVFGMGKLGGRELNFSSDVDLIFVCTDEALRSPGIEKLEVVVRRAVEFIDQMTELGRVFRVDLRLRPEGSRGRLLLSKSGTVEYYLHWGRTWERSAWLKARPVAGNLALGEEVLRQLEPFLYRRHLDFEAIDDLRRMKEMIDEEARAARGVISATRESSAPGEQESPVESEFAKRLKARIRVGGQRSRRRTQAQGPSQRTGEPDDPMERTAVDGWDVKVGRGGIREIEFFVQALQLVHCGTRDGLRVRTTLEALDRLLYVGLLSGQDHEELSDAYDFLRRVEHRIQMAEDRQSHRLPEGRRNLDEFAGRLEMEFEEFLSLLVSSREQVRAIFERLFSESPRRAERATVGEESPGVLEELVGRDPDRLLDKEVIEALTGAGFQRPQQLAGQLQVLRRKEHGPFSTDPHHFNPTMARFLLGSVQSAPDSEAALANLVKFSTTVGNMPSVWAMLASHPHASRLLIYLFGSSRPLARLLAEEPEVFERLIYSGSARMERPFEEMAQDLRMHLESVQDRARKMGRIRRFHREELVRIALHEVAGAIPVQRTCEQLSYLATLVLEEIFREVVEDFVQQNHGASMHLQVETIELSVFGMGKLGSQEMGFGSDLDFFFVYREVEGFGHQEATRIARRFVKALSAAREIGDLYDIDLRLRPSGSQGTLVVSCEAWEAYHRRRAQLWERQALVRARAITGARSLIDRLEHLREVLAYERELPRDAMAQIGNMRDRMEYVTGAEFDVKRSPGGLVDIEFITQALQLQLGQELIELRELRSTFEVLEWMSRSKEVVQKLPVQIDLEALRRDYAWLRRLECRLQISGLGGRLPADGARRRAVVRQMGHQGQVGEASFVDELAGLSERVSRAFAQVFEGQGRTPS